MTEDQRIMLRNRRRSRWMNLKDLCGYFIEGFCIAMIACILILGWGYLLTGFLLWMGTL